MSFLNPEAIYYMLIPLIALFVLLLTQKETQESFFTPEIMDRLKVSVNTLTLRDRNIFFFIIGILIILALAKPVINDGKIMVKAKSSDIMIALDISDSMLAEDVYPNRLDLAKQKALIFLKKAINERIGILAFAKESYLVSPLSFDTDAVSFLLTQLDTTSITQKGTDFLSVLEVFASSSQSKNKKYLLLLSDGGDSKDFTQEISFAKENNIVVFILGIGTTKGAPVKLKDGTFIKQNSKVLVTKLNEDIVSLATSTGGVYIKNVTSSSDVDAMFKEIKQIAKSKELKSEEITKHIHLFYYPVGLALFLLLIAISSFSKKLQSNIFIFILVFGVPKINAGILDFIKLDEAKEAYEAGNYEKSAKLYGSYAKESKKSESFFNEANSLYKQKKYKEALSSYKNAIFKDETLNAKKLSNMGNTYAKSKDLKNAIKSYEESLKIKEDKETRENLEAVKKLMKKKNNKQDKKNQNSKNQKNNKKDDKKNSKDTNENSDKKDKSKKEDDSSKSKNSKDEQQNKDDMKSKKEKDSNQDSKEQQKKDKEKKEKLKKLDKEDKNKSKSSKAQKISKDKMSDAEEAKWLKELNMQKNTYLYKLDTKKHKKEIDNEKPW